MFDSLARFIDSVSKFVPHFRCSRTTLNVALLICLSILVIQAVKL